MKHNILSHQKLSPLSWLGKAAGSIFGLATKEHIRHYADTLQSLNKQMEALADNDQELDNAIQDIDQRLKQLVNFTIKTMNGMALLNMLQDLRELMRHSTALMKTAMLRIPSVLLASYLGTISPLLSQVEILNTWLSKLRIHTQ